MKGREFIIALVGGATPWPLAPRVCHALSRMEAANSGGYRSVLRRFDLAKASRAPSRSRLWSRSPSLAAAIMCFARNRPHQFDLILRGYHTACLNGLPCFIECGA